MWRNVDDGKHLQVHGVTPYREGDGGVWGEAAERSQNRETRTECTSVGSKEFHFGSRAPKCTADHRVGRVVGV